jgi:hypothetical protein
MTQDEIIEIAREAGFFVKDNDAYSPSVQEDHELTPFLVAFANLVAAKEREACAKVCEQHPDGMTMLGGVYVACAEAIRARGEQA